MIKEEYKQFCLNIDEAESYCKQIFREVEDLLLNGKIDTKSKWIVINGKIHGILHDNKILKAPSDYFLTDEEKQQILQDENVLKFY